MRQDRPAANRIVAPAGTRGLPLADELREPAGVAAGVDGFRRARALSSRIACAVDLSGKERPADTISDGFEDDDPHRIGIVPRRDAEAPAVVAVDDGVPSYPTRTAPRPGGPPGLPDPETLGLLPVRRTMDDLDRRRLQGCSIAALTGHTVVTGAAAVPEAQRQADRSPARSRPARNRNEPGGPRAAGVASRCPGGNFFANPIRSDGVRRAARGLDSPPQTGQCGDPRRREVRWFRIDRRAALPETTYSTIGV